VPDVFLRQSTIQNRSNDYTALVPNVRHSLTYCRSILRIGGGPSKSSCVSLIHWKATLPQQRLGIDIAAAEAAEAFGWVDGVADRKDIL